MCVVTVELQDDNGARREAEFLVNNALLLKVGDSFRVHDLLLDFIKLECRSRQGLVNDAVRRQAHFLGRLPVLRDFDGNDGLNANYYALIRLWRSLEELSGNKQLEVETYEASLGELGQAESTDLADAYALIGGLYNLQVSSWCIFHGHLRLVRTRVSR